MSPLSVAATGRSVVAAAVAACEVCEPYAAVMPQLKSQVAARPWGFTVAFRTAPDAVTELGLPSAASGGGIEATASAPAAFRRRPPAKKVVRPVLRSAPFRTAVSTAATDRVG
jgi:hypothetical protein